MTAHEVDNAAKRIGELTSQSIEDAVLAAVTFGLALAATWYRPSLAMPLTIGALAMTLLAGRAFVAKFLLVDELAADRDAYCISAVSDFGARAASIEHRRVVAATVRVALAGSAAGVTGRPAAARTELEQLIRALEDESIDWEPQTVVALEHWLDDPNDAFRDPMAPAVLIRSRVRSVLAEIEAHQFDQ